MVNKLNRVADVEREHFDVRHGDAEFGICPTGLAFIQYLLAIMLPSLHFRMVMCISHAIVCWKYVICFFIFILQGFRIKRLQDSQKKL